MLTCIMQNAPMRQYGRNTEQLQTWIKVPQEPCSVLAGRYDNLAEPISFETLHAPGVSLRDAVDGRCPSEWYEEPIELPASVAGDFIVCHMEVSWLSYQDMLMVGLEPSLTPRSASFLATQPSQAAWRCEI